MGELDSMSGFLKNNTLALWMQVGSGKDFLTVVSNLIEEEPHPIPAGSPVERQCGMGLGENTSSKKW